MFGSDQGSVTGDNVISNTVILIDYAPAQPASCGCSGRNRKKNVVGVKAGVKAAVKDEVVDMDLIPREQAAIRGDHPLK